MMALVARLLRGFSGYRTKAAVAPVPYVNSNGKRAQSANMDSDDEDGLELCIPVPAQVDAVPSSTRRRAAIDMHKGEGCARGMKEDAGYHARCSMDSSRSSDDIDSKYSDMALIHRGRHAMLYRARERRSRNRVVLKLYASATTSGARAVARDKEQRVHELLAGVQGLVSVRSVVVTGDGTYMVMDACNGGTLIEAIANAGGKLPERQVAVKVALPLLRVLTKLHALGIVHRHIRPEHLLISSGQLLLGDLSVAAITRHVAAGGAAAHADAVAHKPGQAAARVSVELLASSVADPVHGAVVVDTRMASSAHNSSASTLSHAASSSRFADLAGAGAAPGSDADGSSSSEPVDVLNHRVGSIEYMAPEMLNKPTSAEVFHLVLAQGIDEDELPVYDEKVDIWSLGVVLFEAVTGYQPFLADSAADMAAVIGQRMAAVDANGVPEFLARHSMSLECQKFLLACLQVDPAQRASAEELLGHPWLRAMVCASRMASFDSRKSSGGVPAAVAAAAAAAAAGEGGSLDRGSYVPPVPTSPTGLRRSLSMQVNNDTPTANSLRSRTSRSIGLRPAATPGLCPA